MVVVAVDDHPVEDDRAAVPRADRVRQVDQRRSRDPGRSPLHDPVPWQEGRRSWDRARAHIARVGGDAAGDVERETRRVDQDRDLAGHPRQRLREQLALPLGVVVGGIDDRGKSRDTHDHQLRLDVHEPLDHDLAPRRTFRVLPLEKRRIHPHVHEAAVVLREGHEPPTSFSGDPFDGREPLGRVRVAHERDRDRAVRIAEDAVPRRHLDVLQVAAIANEQLGVVPGAPQGRCDVGRKRLGPRPAGAGVAGRFRGLRRRGGARRRCRTRG